MSDKVALGLRRPLRRFARLMNDREARRIFRSLKVNSDYVWEPPEMYRDRHETIVMRVRSKSLQVGEKPGVTIDALWFFVRTKDGKTSFGEGHPAGAANGWQRLSSMPLSWTGDRPTRTPIHPHYKCYDCEVSFKEAPKVCPHCFEEMSVGSYYGGEHDDTCSCEDCTT